jgi:hypothetical protein
VPLAWAKPRMNPSEIPSPVSMNSRRAQGQSTKRVLFIALEFPPVQTTGMFRSLRFVSRLAKFGIEPVVVSIDPDEGAEIFGVQQNPRLMQQIPVSTEVHRLRYGMQERDANRWIVYARMVFRISDGYFSRLRDGFDELLRSGKLRHIDAIYASLPPFGAGQLALHARHVLNAPLIIDMRDAWSEFGSHPFPSYLHFAGVRQLEQRVLRAASRVIAVTPQLREMLHRLVPERSKEQFVWVPNSSEAQHFSDRIEWKPDPLKTIDVGYVGSFYFNQRYHRLRSTPWYRKSPHHWFQYHATRQDWEYRTPRFFFRAWQELDRIDAELGSRIRFHLIGDTPDWLPSMAQESGVFDRCLFHGRLMKHEVREKLESLDWMLCTSIKVHDGEDFCLASKTFEYLDAGKPVLGFVCPGAQRDFLLDSRTGIVMDPDDKHVSARSMASVFREGVELAPDVSYLASFSADATTKKLADIISSMLSANESVSFPDR